jgi:2-polyprenyl-3-methyl-5-hydroxy-6-metoxy-1,4-benzoquinol methylase
MHEKVKCKACFSLDTERVLRDVSDINFGMTSNTYHWYRCKDCGTWSISAAGSFLENLDDYYSEYDPHTHKVKVVSNYSVTPISLVIKELAVDFSLKTSALKVLDVGCGDGNFLFNLREVYPTIDLHGLDVNIDAAERNLIHCNVKLWKGDLAGFSPGTLFDIINCSQILEHLEDPTDLIRIFDKFLKPDGIVFIDVPNIQSRSFKYFRSYWVHLDTPRHRVLFTPESLKRLLITHGYKTILVKKFGTGFAYVSSILLFLRLNYEVELALPFRIKWILSKMIHFVLRSDDKMFLKIKRVKHINQVK